MASRGPRSRAIGARCRIRRAIRDCRVASCTDRTPGGTLQGMDADAEERTDNYVETGRISIVVGMNSSGTQHGYRVEGMSPVEAIGHMTVILDIMREQAKISWLGGR